AGAHRDLRPAGQDVVGLGAGAEVSGAEAPGRGRPRLPPARKAREGRAVVLPARRGGLGSEGPVAAGRRPAGPPALRGAETARREIADLSRLGIARRLRAGVRLAAGAQHEITARTAPLPAQRDQSRAADRTALDRPDGRGLAGGWQ